MDTFEELGLAPELVEALAAEGIETPTPLQRDAIPVLRKGNNLVFDAGPGSGLLVAWASPLLMEVEPSELGPSVVVLCHSADTAEQMAEAVGRLAAGVEHRVAALGSPWVLPGKANVLFGTPQAVLDARRAHDVSLDQVAAVVIDQASWIESAGMLGAVEQVFDYLPGECQRILSAHPSTPKVDDLVGRAFKRTMSLPAKEADAPPKRGEVRFRIGPEPREGTVLTVVQDVLSGGARHVLLYSATEDRAADLGDYLTLHGFHAGAPGDDAVPVWLAVDALEARGSIDGVEGVSVVSADCPADPDTLDRRHSVGIDSGAVVLLPREVAHMRALAKRTGYTVVPFPPKATEDSRITALRARLTEALESEDTAPYLLVLEPLLSQYDPAEVAAAALRLLHSTEPASNGPAARAAPERSSDVPTPSWAKLFVSVGDRDGLEKGDLLGAITGETGVAGDAVGRIDIKESHSLVEVHDTVARDVIRAINGTTIKGRAVRADFDRPRKTGPRRPKPRR
ncbi:MAG: DbpA RNA binding domain-containing protein [Gemmatimonadota bacterium]